jgi:uncharacterized protein (TIGR02271 family)
MAQQDPPHNSARVPQRPNTGRRANESRALDDDVPDSRQKLELREEELVASKETIQSGAVRLRKRVEEAPVRLEIEELHDELEIEHIPVGQVVAERAEAREEGGMWIIPVYEEQLVTVKRLVLKEELRVRRLPTRETRLVEDTVRRERLDIEDESVADRVHERYPTDEPEEKESFLDRTVRKVIS